jgi:hypothetical protein
MLGPSAYLLLENRTDAQHRHWLVYEPIYLWTGNVTVFGFSMALSPLYLHGWDVLRNQLASAACGGRVRQRVFAPALMGTRTVQRSNM